MGVRVGASICLVMRRVRSEVFCVRVDRLMGKKESQKGRTGIVSFTPKHLEQHRERVQEEI